MMNCNWMVRNNLIKRKMLSEINVDHSQMNGKEVDQCFKEHKLVFPKLNNRGVA